MKTQTQAAVILSFWELQDQLARWASLAGWKTRIFGTKLEERAFGIYRAPALELRRGGVVLISEPISSATGCDFYQSPKFDNVWHIYHKKNGWLVSNDELFTRPKRLTQQTCLELLAAVKM